MAQIIKRGSKWQYRVWFNDPETGKQKSVSKSGFSTKREANAAAVEMEQKKNQNRITTKENILFGDYYVAWVKANKLGRYSASTDNNYRNSMRIVTTSPISQKKLKQITRIDYQKFIDDYAFGTPKNPKTHAKNSVRKINIHIRSAVKDAIDDGIIYSDFTRKVIIGGNEPKDTALKYLELDEASKLREIALEKADLKHITYAIIAFAIATGCRYEEIVGLTWDCVDFNKKTVNINKAYDYQKRTGFKKVKTDSSTRIISIDTSTLKMLSDLKHEQQVTFLKHGFRNDKQFVFINYRLEVPTDSAANKTLHSILKDIKAKNQTLSMHGLRHTHTSILLAKNVSLDYISERLGHKNTTITSTIYAHLLESKRKAEDSKAINVISNL